MSNPPARSRFEQLRGIALLAFLFADSPEILRAWTPGPGSPGAADGFVVNTNRRSDVLSFYKTVYPASEGYAADMAWTGSVSAGIAGTTSAAFQEDVRRRINFYRALAGLPGDIVFDPAKNSEDQDAALMMSANNALSHMPPTTWTYYTTTGADAASKSNLVLGLYGPPAVDLLIDDDGGDTSFLGHRRWLLYPAAAHMGTGDVPRDGGFNPANAIWVLTDFNAPPPPKFVPWPNAGYVPTDLVPIRWSLSYPNADFSGASVTMTQGGANIPTTINSTSANGYGDNTLVWTPTGIPTSVTVDTTYNVTVTGIAGSEIPANFSYTVTLFNLLIAPPSSDFNGDSKPDFFFFNPTSLGTYVWYLNGPTAVGSAPGPTLPAGWSVVDVGDFNVDGKPDLLLFHESDQRTYIYYMNGPTAFSSAPGPTLPAGWSVAGVGDFNGDGKPDLLLFHASDLRTYVYYMNGPTAFSSAPGPTLPAGWSVAGVGDFNGDGKPDLLLFHASDQRTYVYYMNGPTAFGSAPGPTLPAGWSVAGVGDFNGDGKPDLLLFHASDLRTYVYFMNGPAAVSSAPAPTLPAGWSLVAP